MTWEDRDEYYPIESAIQAGDLAYARELLRDALQTRPGAHVWYLSALVAHDPQQREQRLRKALSHDPHHEAACAALNNLHQPDTSRADDTRQAGLFARLRSWLD